MYLKWNSKIIKNFSEKNIANLYDNGFVFTRENKGSMDQTRSLRINLDTFELTSENKRILRKTEHIFMKTYALPYEEYHWSIGKLAKNFYDTKFKKGTFSAQKIKELLTDWKHWIGWILTTTAIIVYSHFIGIHAFHTTMFIPNFKAFGLLVIVAIIDTIKHKIKLQ